MSRYPLFKLNDLASEWCKGQPFKKTDIAEQGQSPCVHYGELFTKYGVVINQCLSKTSIQGKRLSVFGDILFPASDVTPSGLARCSALMQDNVILGGDMIIMRPRHGNDSRYLSYAINYQKEQILQRVTGALIKHLSSNALKSVVIPVPPLLEQVNVVLKLEKVSALIAFRKQQLAKLEQLVKSRFVEMFGDKGYPEDSLLNLCNIIDYRGKTPEKVEYGLPFITAKNIRMHQMNLEPREYISKETYDKVMVRGFPKEGDVVFTTEAPLGNVCRIPHFDTEFYIGQRIVTLQTEKLEPIYLEYALSADDFKMKYMGKSSGSTVTGIRVRLLEQLTIPVPPIELQEQFAAFVEQTDKSKFEIQQSLEKLETLKKSLMQQYFG